MKNKKIILIIALPILFIGLHFSVYVTGLLYAFPGLTTLAPQPLDIEKLTLTETIFPTYTNPFQTVEYHYSDKSTGEIVLIERGSLFSTDIKQIKGDPGDYYDTNVDGIFHRGIAVHDYPNALFFVIQYLLIVAFVILLIKQCRHKKS